jgi:aldehyde:ferredoxin oxidoreductase
VPATDLGAEKVEFTLKTQYWTSLTDVLNLCQFDWGATWQLYGPEVMADVVNAVTGWEVDSRRIAGGGRAPRQHDEGLQRARRLLRARTTSSRKRLHEPLKGGISDGLQSLRKKSKPAKDLYYRMAGWDMETGNPDAHRLEELGIGWIA